MPVRALTRAHLRAFLATLTLIGLLTPTAQAQWRLSSGGNGSCTYPGYPGPCALPTVGSPGSCPQPGLACPAPAVPSQGTTPGSQPGTTPGSQPGTTPGSQPGTTPGTAPSQEAQQAFGQDANFNQESSSARGGDQVAMSGGGSGYLDPVLPANRFRLRYDSVYNDNRPDRAEYFYAKCGCFRAAGDPHAPGPILPETNVNYQDLDGYLEVAPWKRFSVFLEAPVRFLNPEQNANTTGIGDTKTGFRWAMVYDPKQVLTLQMKTYIPTGNVGLGLGTGHFSIEPSLLYLRPLTNKLLLQGQLTDWIPIGGTDFAGNVFSYGAALTYIAYDTGCFRVAPVLETLGWTVLSGQEFDFPENVVRSAAGVTIVNVKMGVRFGFGQIVPGFLGKSDLYVGYGRAVTGDVWYKDIVRLEYRISF